MTNRSAGSAVATAIASAARVRFCRPEFFGASLVMPEILLRYAYVALFVGSIVEGDATLITAGFLARRGYLHLWVVILVAAAATMLANEFYYRVARFHGEEAFQHKADHDPRLARVRKWIQSQGPLLLFFSRFMWGFRIAIPLTCGAVAMRRTRFSVINAAGAVVWAVPVGLAGYFLGHELEHWLTDIRRYEWGIAAILLLGVFIVLLAWKSKEFREEGAALVAPATAVVHSAQHLSGKLKSR
jgi:membrane protein DedA with SNARE-associated domain